MTEVKKPEPIGPVQQFQLLLYATKDTELTACDVAVLAELTDRYLKDGPRAGFTRATSAAHLARETGRTERPVQKSLIRLAERGYVTIAEQGQGQRGNVYTLPFEWVRATAAAIYAVIKQMADAKKRRKRKRRRSYAAESVASTDTVATLHATYLRGLVTLPTAYLDTVATLPTAPQSYGLPTEGPIGADMSAGTYRVPPPVVTKKIVSASVENEDGESWLSLEFGGGGGDSIVVESNDAEMQAQGQRELEQLVASAGLRDLDDAAQLVGRTVYLQAGRYVPAPDDVQEPDNTQEAA
ncbi:hypothetical protein IVB34_22115 [Bradyrhizobium sp. 2]|uniref:hypothetical protein n=1 Tax=unclassified Bradyrhizobium TaxID=2631580 RepID=UPI001FFBA5ED|nr:MULTISPECIES: hypothetical protein [unclassified Bradyrhizobium]MCK1445873.1 hypothetical protein [Bradyrhizobium sp. 48]MCK1460982.1 hypothetical protein [Bradyrhizobium sp. 2]